MNLPEAPSASVFAILVMMAAACTSGGPPSTPAATPQADRPVDTSAETDEATSLASRSPEFMVRIEEPAVGKHTALRVAGLWWQDGWRVGLVEMYKGEPLRVHGFDADGTRQLSTVAFEDIAPYPLRGTDPWYLDFAREPALARSLDGSRTSALPAGLRAYDFRGAVLAANWPVRGVALRPAGMEHSELDTEIVFIGDELAFALHRPPEGWMPPRRKHTRLAFWSSEAVLSTVLRRVDTLEASEEEWEDRRLLVDWFDDSGALVHRAEVDLRAWVGTVQTVAIRSDKVVYVVLASLESLRAGSGGALVRLGKDDAVALPVRLRVADIVGRAGAVALLECGGEMWMIARSSDPTGSWLHVAGLGRKGTPSEPVLAWEGPAEDPANIMAGSLFTACHEGEAAVAFSAFWGPKIDVPDRLTVLTWR